MSRPKMPEAQRAEIRTQILDAAYDLLIEKGPGQISSRAVAQHLALTHMGLFTYFPNQAAIRQALAEREQTKFLNRLQILIEQAEKEELTRALEKALQTFQEFARENANLFQLSWLEPGTGKSPHWMQMTIELIAGLIFRGMEQGVFKTSDAHISASLVVSLVNMPFVLSSNGKITRPDDEEKLSREALAAAMRYIHLGVQPEAAGRSGIRKITGAWIEPIRKWFGNVWRSHETK